jgi:hypothetical protein
MAPKRGHFFSTLLRLTDLDRLHPRLGFLPGLERDWANLSYGSGRRRLFVDNRALLGGRYLAQRRTHPPPVPA